MLYDVFWMGGGFAFLTLGAEGLVRGSSGLALRLGLTPLVIGLTVVAFGTSSPELLVSLRTAWAGQGSLAVGNVVGSNIANFALILGLAALVRPLAVQTQVVRFDIPVVIVSSAALAALLFDGRLGRVEGAGLLAALVAYLTWNVRSALRETGGEDVGREAVGTVRAATASRWSLAADVGLLAVGLVGLGLGAEGLVTGAVGLATRFGVSEAVIGLTVVAVGTSLPELATSLVAAARGEGDIAIGNAVGSNVFNVLGVIGPAAVILPLPRGGVGPLDLGVMVGAALLMLPLMRTGYRLTRLEGLLLLTGYVTYVAYLVAYASG
jgi:cation:H+ antiporter